MTSLGKTLLIANPKAQIGHGETAAARVEAELRGKESACSSLDVVYTAHERHAEELAAAAGAYDSVVCLGGDGTIHETVNGFMRLPRSDRPTLAVVPMGSGNDYARTLELSFNVDEAVSQLLSGQKRSVDLGLCNGEYYDETLSFGLDAGIALDTRERRKRTQTTGLRLYASSAADQLLHHKDYHECTMRVDGGEPRKVKIVLMAVQNGRCYGSGFKICPEAQLDDGLLDICIAHGPVSTAKAALVFMRAKKGAHAGFREIEMFRARKLELDFASEPPVQADGEPMHGTSYSIEVVPGAIDVVFPSR